MRSRPECFDEHDLTAALAGGWGLAVANAQYAPVGGGSYHWTAHDPEGVPHWVTVDDLSHKDFLGTSPDLVFENLRRAFDTAIALRDGGLGFAVAPVPSRAGASVHRAGTRYAVSLFPYLDVPTGRWGERRTPAERAAVVDVLARLHTAPHLGARTVRPEVPFRVDLEHVLSLVDSPLGTHAPEVRALLDRFDALAERTVGTPVLTHGEPHPGNVVFAGALRLLDWDTVGVALAERDLWMLDRPEERARYTALTGRPVDGAAVELYRLRWLLDDVASAVRALRAPSTVEGTRAARWLAGPLDVTPYGPP